MDKEVSPQKRRQRLARWSQEAPYGRLAHPREEHLLPLHVVSGYTKFSAGKIMYDGWVSGCMSLACLGFWGPDAATSSVNKEKDPVVCKG